MLECHFPVVFGASGLALGVAGAVVDAVVGVGLVVSADAEFETMSTPPMSAPAANRLAPPAIARVLPEPQRVFG